MEHVTTLNLEKRKVYFQRSFVPIYSVEEPEIILTSKSQPLNAPPMLPSLQPLSQEGDSKMSLANPTLALMPAPSTYVHVILQV